MKNRIAVVGAGIIGSAVAFELTRCGADSVDVLDPDLEGELSSTERNAGGVRHLWIHPVNAELSRRSIEYFEKVREEIGFHQNGYLWLYSQQSSALGEKALVLAQKRGLPYEALEGKAITARYPFLDKIDDVAFGVHGRKDGILNSNALKLHYQNGAKKRGARFQDRTLVKGIAESGATVQLMVSHPPTGEAARESLKSPSHWAGSELLTYDQVVICAGAWSSEILKSLSLAGITKPVRRQIATFQAENLDLTPYGMIVDTSGVYFHAEGGNCLAGIVLKNEPEGYRFHLDNDFFETHIWPPLFERSSKMERLRPLTGWVGLYSYSPDITLGPVPGTKRVYEAHSFTGHGVMHSLGAAAVISETILFGAPKTPEMAQLSRDRFVSGRLLDERLHI
ncbi:MAG: FAD-binding oxidoreductase [Deltaproteobacteria bacterium]|nr:FAD-binding oxidoreductase [Deltaproteobacteria bacterium]